MNSFNFYRNSRSEIVRVDNDSSTPLWQRAEALVDAGIWTVIARDVPEILVAMFMDQLREQEQETRSFAA